MASPTFESSRLLVENTLSETQQIAFLDRKADAAGWAQADQSDCARLELLGKVIYALQGSYNASGIQRWFERPNPHLQNRAPADIFVQGWKTGDRSIQALLIVSQSLCGDPARAASCENCNPPKPIIP